MPGLPIHPLAVATTLLAGAVAMALALLLSARRQPEPIRSAQQTWARGLVFLPLGWVLLESARLGASPAWAILAKALFMAAFVEYLRAVRQLLGEILPWRWFWTPVLAVALLSLGFTLAHPADPMRTGLLSLLCAAAAASTAQTALRQRREDGSPQTRVLAGCFVVVAVVMVGRAGLLYLPADAALRQWAESPLAQSLLLGLCALGPAVATLAFVLMGADRLLDRLDRLARRDTLTGAASRHGFMESATSRCLQARRAGEPLSVIVLDVDRFKSVNDAFGHAGGDQALQCVAETLRAGLRDQDLLGRLGGEEFAVLLPGADLALARHVAERLRAGVAAIRLDLDQRPVPLRISAGIATLEARDEGLHALLLRADRGLYEAKRGGRDQVGEVA